MANTAVKGAEAGYTVHKSPADLQPATMDRSPAYRRVFIQ